MGTSVERTVALVNCGPPLPFSLVVAGLLLLVIKTPRLRFPRLAALGMAGILVSASLCAQKIESLDAARALAKKSAQELLDQGKASSLVIGILTSKAQEIHGFGPTKPDGRTIFEIGSITKVFTALVFSELVVQQKLELETPVKTLLPKEQKLPRHVKGDITLLDLATHTSGLPRMLPIKSIKNPFADRDAAAVYSHLEHLASQPPGKHAYTYSNLGAGLLGHCLSRKCGKPYEKMVIEGICRPLGLTDTLITIDAERAKRLAPGHSVDLRRDQTLTPTGNWDFKALAGCGALRSTANDLLYFLRCQLDLAPSPIRAAMDASQLVARKRPGRRKGVALAWHLDALPGKKRVAIWHNGGTGGYSSYAGFVKEAGVAVVILNSSNWNVTKLGFELLATLAR